MTFYLLGFIDVKEERFGFVNLNSILLINKAPDTGKFEFICRLRIHLSIKNLILKVKKKFKVTRVLPLYSRWK